MMNLGQCGNGSDMSTTARVAQKLESRLLDSRAYEVITGHWKWQSVCDSQKHVPLYFIQKNICKKI